MTPKGHSGSCLGHLAMRVPFVYPTGSTITHGLNKVVIRNMVTRSSAQPLDSVSKKKSIVTSFVGEFIEAKPPLFFGM